MSDKILYGVAYLEGDDINPDCSVKPHVNQGKPLLVMVQANFCGWCTKAKPAVQALSKSGDFMVATVQSDGGPSDLAAAKALERVNTARGVPAFLVFGRDGKFLKMHDGDRSEEALRGAMSGL